MCVQPGDLSPCGHRQKVFASDRRTRQQIAQSSQQLVHPRPCRRRDRRDHLDFGSNGSNVPGGLFRQQIDLVPDFEDRNIRLSMLVEHTEVCQHLQDLLLLRIASWIGDVTNMQDNVRRRHLLESCTKGSHELSWQIGYKPDCVRDDRLFHSGQPNGAHRWIESGEQKVFRHDVRAGQPVEKCGFTCVGVTD